MVVTINVVFSTLVTLPCLIVGAGEGGFPKISPEIFKVAVFWERVQKDDIAELV